MSNNKNALSSKRVLKRGKRCAFKSIFRLNELIIFTILLSLMVYLFLIYVSEFDRKHYYYTLFHYNTTGSYFVNTRHCKIPHVEPLANDISFTPMPPSNCNAYEPLYKPVYSPLRVKYFLKLNLDAMKNYTLTENTTEAMQRVNCYYREIKRSGIGLRADYEYKFLPKTRIQPNCAIPRHIEFMVVNCTIRITQLNSTKILTDMYGLIQHKRRNEPIVAAELQQRRPSVILIGIDSLSRINLRRNMPKTFDYLVKNNWFELQGYTKIGFNTFPNLMAVLTGYDQQTVVEKCEAKKLGGLDKCPFIWNYFAKRGYRTAFAEDNAFMNTLNYFKIGIVKKPTDYFLRPVLLAAEKELKAVRDGTPIYCLGNKQYSEYVFDYALEYIKRYKYESIFGLFWVSSFSHDKFDVASSMDQQMVQYMESFERAHLLTNSIVIFFSDHGVNNGKILESSQSFFEQRLPMFFISLPNWFRSEHPEFVSALRINQNRLISHFDLHSTLKHILELYEPGTKYPPPYSCPTCQSIFLEVPDNRTCAEASIPEFWCPCIVYKSVDPSTRLVQDLALSAVDKINAYLWENGLKLLCQDFKLIYVKNAEIETVSENEMNPQIQTYKLVFVANPASAIFQTRILYNNRLKNITMELDYVSRLDRYASYVTCLPFKEAERFCICNNSAEVNGKK